MNSGANLTSTGLLLQFDSGTGTLLGGDFDVSGTFQFPDANIVNIGAGATLILRGDHYLITPGGDVNALAGLANNFGTLEFDNLSFETLGGFGNFGDLSFGGGGGGDFGFNGDLSNGGFIDLTGNNWMVTAQNLNNIGTLDLEGVADMFRVEGFFNAGYVRVRQGSTLATEVDFTNLSSGYVQVDGGSSYPSGGLLTVGGNFTNDGEVKVLGGNSEGPGMLTTTGLFTNTSTGMLELDSGNGAPGGQVMVGSIMNSGSIYVGTGATLNLTSQPGGVTDVPLGASWQIYGNFTEGESNFGFENLTGIEGTVDLENQQSSTINPRGGTLSITGSGALDVGNGTTLTIMGNVDNSGFLSTGRYHTGGGNSLMIAGILTNEASASFALNGAIDSATIGGLTNSGTVDVENGSTLQISGDVSNSGMLETNANGLGGGNTVTVTGMLTNTLTGQVNLNGPGDVLQALAGLSNNGVINVNNGSSIDPPFLNNLGTVNIGAGSRMLVGTGSPMGTGYIQLANGTLGEMISSTGFGVINVNGSSLLDGTLAILLQGGFNPAAGSTYKFLNFTPGMLSGIFASIENDIFNGGTEKWVLDYENGAGYVELIAEPNGGPPPVSEPATLLVLVPGLLGMSYGLRRRLLK